jgi:ElaB/YqjD/DUF883 family membrane-anchored ribosome-binding protein
MGRVVEQAQAGYQQVAERAHDGLNQVNKVVRGNPDQSIGAVFGVGIAGGGIIGLSVGFRRY